MNILVIAIDTLRADHLGCHGYARNTSPNIDRLASEGVQFDTMIAPAVPTHPSFVTYNTGQYPITHGVVAHGGTRGIPRRSPWLPALLQRAGYTTCAIDNLGDWRLGFSHGFEFYIDPMHRQELSINSDNRLINERAIPWLEQHAREKFFLFVHYWDPHTPYLPPRAYRTLFYKGDPCDPNARGLEGMETHPLGRTWRETWFPKLAPNLTDPEYVVAMYDGEIRYCDEGVGALLRKVDELGLRDDTLVVLFSDHGEQMYRHRIFFDHHGLYDGVLHVPLIIRCPGLASRRVEHLAAHVDIAPTLLDLAGAEPSPEMEGTSLVPFMRGEDMPPPRDFVVSQECTWQMKWSIRTRTHKLILAREDDFYHSPRRELYDLESDPHELNDIAESSPDRADDLERRLESWIAEGMAKNGLNEDPLSSHGITLGNAWKDPNDSQRFA